MFLICSPFESKEKQLLFLKAFLIDFDEKIFFISEYDYDHAQVVKVPVQKIFPKIPLLRGLIKPLLPYLKYRNEKHKNILIIHDEIFSSTMIHALFTKIFMRTKVLVYGAESVPYSPMQKLASWFFSPFVDAVLCPSRDACDQVKKAGIQKVRQCPLPTEPSRNEIRYTNHICRIGFFGKLVGQKGIQLLCEAMKEFPSSSLIVYGDGPKLKRFKDYKIDYRGVYSKDKIDLAFSEIDLLVVPSISQPRVREQFGRVVVEAMERGVLVIGSNSGAIPEVIEDERLIFQENNVSAIADKIRYVLSLPESEVVKIKKTLRERFERKYSAAAIKTIVFESLSEMSL